MSSMLLTGSSRTAGPRWLLLGSLALNLFFIGIAGSMAARHFMTPTPAASERRDADRIEQIAATLPAGDADKLRAQFAAHRLTVEAARDNVNRKRDGIRATLRAEPFKVEEMRKAMAETRAAHEAFFQSMGTVVSSAAEQMSSEGRNKLADFRAPRP